MSPPRTIRIIISPLTSAADVTRVGLLLHLVVALSAGFAMAASPHWPDLSEPLSSGGGEQDVAIVVGVERYAFLAPVPGANRNAGDWYNYFIKGRHIPLSKTQLLRNEDATIEGLRAAIANAVAMTKPGGTLWFVFVGHGAPDTKGKGGVLVGYDVQAKASSLYARSLPQRVLLANVGQGKQARTVVILDASFSGQDSLGSPLVPRLQPLLVTTPADVPIRTTILSAGRTSEFAGALPGADRPAFGYLLLGSFRGWADKNRDGNVTAVEALDYVAGAIRTLVKDHNQTPQIQGDLGSTILASNATERGPLLSEVPAHDAPGLADTDTSTAASPLLPSSLSTDDDNPNRKGLEFLQADKPSQAAIEFNRGCDAGMAESCVHLGVMYLEGLGVERNDAKSLSLFSKACYAGDHNGCNNLGSMYERGYGAEKNEELSAHFYSKGCDAGNLEACGSLARMYHEERGRPKNQVRAMSLFTKACDAGEGGACNNLGVILAEGRGMQKDEAKAVRLLSKGCDAGNSSACGNLGSMYARGRGVSQDMSQALKLLWKGCDGGYAEACGAIGLAYEKGRGVSKDEGRAVTLYSKSCDAGIAPCCKNLGSMYEEGRGVRRDTARATALFGKACSLGDKDSCSRQPNN